MHVYLNYRFNAESENEIICANEFFKELGCEVNIEGNRLLVFGNCEKYNSDESVETVYLAKAKCIYESFLKHLKRNITLEGTIDTSETAGECMDFRFAFVDGQIKSKRSPWYMETCMDDIDDYESFCDIVGDFSEEEYDSVKGSEFVFVIESGDQDTLATDIPMLDYDM